MESCKTAKFIKEEITGDEAKVFSDHEKMAEIDLKKVDGEWRVYEVKKESQIEVDIQVEGGFGYKLGDQIDISSISQDDLRFGFISCSPKIAFRSFKEVYLYITPKTGTIYKITGKTEDGNADEVEFETIKALIEKKYNNPMKKDGLGCVLTGSDTKIELDTGVNISLTYHNTKIEKELLKKEKVELIDAEIKNAEGL